MFVRCAIVSVALFVVLGSVHAISQEDKEKMRDAIKPYVTKCVQEYEVSEDQVTELEKKGKVDDVNPCFIACVFQKSGMINSKGMFDVEKTIEITTPFLTKEDDQKVVEKVSKDCAKVNDEDVSDGDKGCDRSKLLFACMVEHKDEIGM